MTGPAHSAVCRAAFLDELAGFEGSRVKVRRDYRPDPDDPIMWTVYVAREVPCPVCDQPAGEFSCWNPDFETFAEAVACSREAVLAITSGVVPALDRNAIGELLAEVAGRAKAA